MFAKCYCASVGCRQSYNGAGLSRTACYPMPLSFRGVEIADIPTTFAVRLATVENVVTMVELEKDYGVTPESLTDTLQSDVRGWLCEDDGRVVGFSLGDRSNGEVLVVAVLPGYEGRGIGEALLSRVRDWLFKEGHDEIWLLANPDPGIRATGFYKHLGWETTAMSRGEDVVLKLRKH